MMGISTRRRHTTCLIFLTSAAGTAAGRFSCILRDTEGENDMATTMASENARRSRMRRNSHDGRAQSAGETERWLSLLGGGSLALYGLGKGTIGGLGLALLGGTLVYRGLTGRPDISSALGARSAEPEGIQLVETTTVLARPDELYRFWRNFENLPRIMCYLESVRPIEDNRYHWVARGPLDIPVEWDAEVTTERPNEMIAWRSLPGSLIETEGSVHFTPAPGNRGTRVKVVMRYNPPAGKIGAAIAFLFGRSAQQECREDLRRFKRFIEAGEIPTTKGQPSGRGREASEQTGTMVVQGRFAEGLGWFSIGLGLAELAAPGAVERLVGIEGHEALLRSLGARELATGIGILTQPRPAGWLWGRVAGDAMDLSLLGAAFFSPNARHGRTALATATVLGVTVLDLLCSLQLTSGPDGVSAGRVNGALHGDTGRRPYSSEMESNPIRRM
jgi:uncharacterized membrane protein